VKQVLVIIPLVLLLTWFIICCPMFTNGEMEVGYCQIFNIKTNKSVQIVQKLWSIILVLFIQIPQQFVTFQWQRKVNKPTFSLFWFLFCRCSDYPLISQLIRYLCVSLLNPLVYFKNRTHKIFHLSFSSMQKPVHARHHPIDWWWFVYFSLSLKCYKL
jgi:hypothetical protein